MFSCYFDDDENCRLTNRGVRKELIDRSFIRHDIGRIARRYDADIVELTIFRLQETDRRSDHGHAKPTDDGWSSELWHSNNFPATDFNIIVYLTEVGEQHGPFEYKVPAEYVPPNPKRSWLDDRYAYNGKGKTVTGPPGTTIIFKNNIVHKGNYCRKGCRDVIMIGLRLSERDPRIGKIMQRLWSQRRQVLSAILPGWAR